MRFGKVCLSVSAAAALLIASPLLVPVREAASRAFRDAQSPCGCSTPREPPKTAPRPKFTGHARDLDDSDEIAALEAVHLALTRTGDGSSYVWHRGNGHLSAVIHPTASFKDAAGRVCRHIVLILTTGPRSSRIEGVACRLMDGRWQLEG
jgi:hypothetical protein